MSARGSTPKMSSLSSMSPPALASRVCTLTFILAFLALVGGGLRLFRLSFLNCVCRRGYLSFRLGGRAGFLLGGDGRDFLVARQRRDLVNRGIVDQAGGRNFDFLGLPLFDQAGRERRGVGPRQLDRIGDGQPAALVTRDRALDEQQAADRIGADDLEVLLSAIARAHVAGHLLVLEHATRILAVAGRTVRTVRDRNAGRGAQALEVPALHGA